MSKYLSMKECFGDVRREDWLLFSSAEYSHCIEIAECSSGVIAEEILHAINSHDELVAMNKELLAALECAEGFVSEVSEKTGFGQVHTLKVIRSAIAKAKAAA